MGAGAGRGGPGRAGRRRAAAGQRRPIRCTRPGSTASCSSVLDDDAVVIGDGGDFVSFAGKYIEPGRPGGWLDPGPFGCLGTGLGYAIAARIARPAAQVVLLLGDGAAGFSLMDADTLVRHGLPVVMVCGNNGGWGLERHPMRACTATTSPPTCSRAAVTTRWCARSAAPARLVTTAADIGPALRRAFAAGVPYLVNVGHRPGDRLPALDHRRVARSGAAGHGQLPRPASRSWRSGRLPGPRRPRRRASW